MRGCNSGGRNTAPEKLQEVLQRIKDIEFMSLDEYLDHLGPDVAQAELGPFGYLHLTD
jgi:hypothetical protein